MGISDWSYGGLPEIALTGKLTPWSARQLLHLDSNSMALGACFARSSERSVIARKWAKVIGGAKTYANQYIWKKY